MVLLLGFAVAALACGPFFPNSILTDGETGVLMAPAVSFELELERFRSPAPPGIVHVPLDGPYGEATTRAEVLDLRAALAAGGRSTNEIEEIVRGHGVVREAIERQREEVETWEARREGSWMGMEIQAGQGGAREPGEKEEPAGPPRPRLEMPELPAGLPVEFADYLRGAAAWHNGETNVARKAWESLLTRPASRRHYKSIWAAYMLGRSWHDEDPAKAAVHYRRTRELARAGFADTASLAVASLGWEAQVKLRAGDLKEAFFLYLDQYAAYDAPGVAASLATTARQALAAPPETRAELARVPQLRQVITAFLLSRFLWEARWDADTPRPAEGMARAWLETIREVGAGEVALAEQLAVLTYQLGDWQAARGWVDLAGDSTVAAWIDAKLRLRDGDVASAAVRLARVFDALRAEEEAVVAGAEPRFSWSLYRTQYDYDVIPASVQARGELGALRVARGEFESALDALLRAGFWLDAAYVAERVLTPEELRGYVDAQWPVLTGREAQEEAAEERSSSTSRGQRERIRYLLARRLTRLNRGGEAAAYYPAEWRAPQQELLRLLGLGEDETLPPRERARGFFGAAWLARTNGIELLGTEVGPDWAYAAGNFEFGLTPEHRARFMAARGARPPAGESEAAGEESMRPEDRINAGGEAASADDAALGRLRSKLVTPAELERARRHTADPERRFHYRYQAAFLAWDAARLLPDNDPEKAFMLYTGGTWLKNRDPITADLFYKALVRTCRRTELGDAADRQRWFPELDATGKPLVTRRAPKPPDEAGTGVEVEGELEGEPQAEEAAVEPDSPDAITAPGDEER